VDDEHLWQAYTWPSKCLRVNFVTTLDGHIMGSDGRSGSLSTQEDRRVFHMLRAGCDAVLVGAGTARHEGYGPVGVKQEWAGLREQPEAPVLVMVSRSGNVPDIEGAVVVDGSDLPALTEEYPRILCEGGPGLFTTLMQQSLVDEVALTLAPFFGGSGGLFTDTVAADAALIHAHNAPDGVYSLWSLA
jgi:riboflavin biosynthesis pyrimidine reductase